MSNAVHPFDNACELLETRFEIELRTVREFTKAYKSYARQNHPDKQGDGVDDEFQNLTNIFNRIRLFEPDTPLYDIAWSEDGDGDESRETFDEEPQSEAGSHFVEEDRDENQPPDQAEPLYERMVLKDGKFKVTVKISVERDGSASPEPREEAYDVGDFEVLQKYIENIEHIPGQAEQTPARNNNPAPPLSTRDINQMLATYDSGNESDGAMDMGDSWIQPPDHQGNLSLSEDPDDTMVSQPDAPSTSAATSASTSASKSGGGQQKSCHAILSKAGRWNCGHCLKRVAKEAGRECKCKWIVLEPKEKEFLPLECPHCQKSFRTREKLNRHILIHTGERPHKCDQCNASFNRKDTLKEHKQLHNSNKTFKCKSCTASFPNSASLKEHSLMHTGLTFKCEQCPSVFQAKRLLAYHVKYCKASAAAQKD